MTIERFDDTEHLPLRVLNRAATLFNLVEASGVDAGLEYLDVFEEGDRKQIAIMSGYVKKFGLKRTRKLVMSGLEIEELSDE